MATTIKTYTRIGRSLQEVLDKKKGEDREPGAYTLSISDKKSDKLVIIISLILRGRTKTNPSQEQKIKGQ